MIEPHSYDDPKLKQLIEILIEWINDELASHRIIVKDIEEDLYDGQVLQKLLGEFTMDCHYCLCCHLYIKITSYFSLEKLSNEKLDVVEVTQSEEGQKQKLKTVLDNVQRILGLGRWNQQKWSVDG